MNVYREEMDELRSILREQSRQLDAERKERKRERSNMQSELEKLRRELSAAHETQGEVKRLKTDLQRHVRRVEHLTAARERIRKDRESIRGYLSAELEKLKKTHARETNLLETTLKKVNLDLATAHSELRKAKKSRDVHSPKPDDSLREKESLRRELSKTKDAAAETQQHLDTQSKELHRARVESLTLKKESSQLQMLLRARTAELKGAQSFLTTADASSGAEVTNALHRLNAEVLQSTAFMAEFMAESLFHETTAQVSKTNEQLVAGRRVSGAIGDTIVHFLGTKKHKDDSILIQIAFQAYLTYHLRCIAHAWLIGGDEQHNRFIDTIYQSLHKKEAQAIAGRWRALTRAHVPVTLDGSQTAFKIANKIIFGLVDILIIAGCDVPKSDIVSALSSKFTNKLVFLVSLAMRVNKIVGEDVTSGDFEVMVVPPTAAFDATQMEDSYDSGSSPTARRKKNIPKVLCTTDLGLRKRTRVGLTGENQWETRVLLKSKVALESVIDILGE